MKIIAPIFDGEINVTNRREQFGEDPESNEPEPEKLVLAGSRNRKGRKMSPVQKRKIAEAIQVMLPTFDPNRAKKAKKSGLLRSLLSRVA